VPAWPYFSPIQLSPLFIFETHPVQYRAPVYRELQKLKPDSFRIFYATDCSVRGHLDRDFLLP
jgi:hypothetical protein